MESNGARHWTIAVLLQAFSSEKEIDIKNKANLRDLIAFDWPTNLA